MTQAALVVDKQGLAKKLAHRPKSFVLFELVQNSWDAPGVGTVMVYAQQMQRGVCRIAVEDTAPAGFTDLASVYTMFRDSEKAGDPEKRGRFELGEKLVAALATRMEVETTKGTVTIEGNKRLMSRARRNVGSKIVVYLKMTKDELSEMLAAARKLIVPPGIHTIINGEALAVRPEKLAFTALLETVRSDAEGVLRPTRRQTTVQVYDAEDGPGMIYEMGIPVVETGDPYHYNVGQRIPVNFERNSVPPAYLRALRVEALNALRDEIPESEATLPWVTDALDDERCERGAVAAIVTKRFGDKAVIYDPSDPEGTKLAVSKGYTVIPGGAFSKGAWGHIREHGIVLPAGQVTPSPKPYSPDGEPENVIPRSAWTADMGCRAEFAAQLFNKLEGRDALFVGTGACLVEIVNEPQASWSANFGRRGIGYRLCLNYGRLGRSWFSRPQTDVEVLRLLIHEFGHSISSDHLSSEYHDALCRLGAKLTNLALNEPEFFR
jgi:hypothetical protein